MAPAGPNAEAVSAGLATADKCYSWIQHRRSLLGPYASLIHLVVVVVIVLVVVVAAAAAVVEVLVMIGPVVVSVFVYSAYFLKNNSSTANVKH